jgi:hypothetical protein
MSEKSLFFLKWQTQIHRLFHMSRLPFDLVRLIWLFFFFFFFLITQSWQLNCPPPLFMNLKGHKFSLRLCQRLRLCCPTGNTLPSFWLRSKLYLVPREATICGTCAFFNFKFININLKRAQVNSSQCTPPPPLYKPKKAQKFQHLLQMNQAVFDLCTCFLN